jgi:hypothetical protein
MSLARVSHPHIKFQGLFAGVSKPSSGQDSGGFSRTSIPTTMTLAERQGHLESTLASLAPDKVNIPHAKLPKLEMLPESVKKDYTRVLKDVSPTDLTSFANKDLMGVLEELADVTHATVQHLAIKTGTLKYDDFKEFNDKAQPLIHSPKARFEYMRNLSQQFVQNIPWMRPKSFLEFTRINGTDKDLPNYDAETSLTKGQLADFLGNFFMSEKIRRTINFAPGFTDPQEFLRAEHAELKENIARWVNNPAHADRKAPAMKAMGQLDKAVDKFVADATPDNARHVFKGIGDLGKILIGVKTLPTRELFDYIMLKVRGRMGGVFLEDLENLHGREGYNVGKKQMKPMEALAEAATLKNIFALNLNQVGSHKTDTQKSLSVSA